ncbi:MAG: major facilitator superfamily 1 [Streptosporangiaceae bacterium]|nr:major facilitator superfamily 1 [Streptosporangiaceae bacterium]
MANPYRELFAIPGARFFVAAAFVGRMSMSMVGIGIVLLVSAVTGSYGIAGAVSATFALAYAAGSTVMGRLADRHGQGRVLAPLVLANCLSMTALILCALLRAPAWAVFAAAAASGVTSPSLGAMVRARWSHLLRDEAAAAGSLHAAFSFESVVDEVIFVAGPMIVTLLATAIHPAAGVAAASLLTLSGCLALALQRRTEPPPRPRRPGQGNAITVPGVRVVSAVFLLLGAVFGSIEVSALGFTAEKGHQALAGPLLGLLALGSGSAALWYGARQWKAPLERRFRIGLVLLVAGLVPLALITNLWVMMALIFFSGLAISPTIIPAYGLVESLVPGDQLTEGLTWISTAIGIGLAAGAWVAGHLVDARGSGTAFLFPLTAGLLAAVVGWASRLHEREPAS